MFFKKRRVVRSISKQLLLTNAMFVMFMLVIFVMNYFFVLRKEQSDVKEMNVMQQTAVQEKLESELKRINSVCSIIGNDGSVWEMYSLAGSEIYEAVDVIDSLTEKIKLSEQSFPYPIEFFIYMNNSDDVISGIGMFSKEILYSVLDKKGVTNGAVAQYFHQRIYPQSDIWGQSNEKFTVFDDLIIYSYKLNTRCSVIAKLETKAFGDMLLSDNAYDTVITFDKTAFVKTLSLDVDVLDKLLTVKDGESKNVTLGSNGKFYAYTSGINDYNMKVISLASQQNYHRMKQFVWEWLLMIFCFVVVNALFLMKNINIYRPLDAVVKRYGANESNSALQIHSSENKVEDLPEREWFESNKVMQRSVFLYLCSNNVDEVDWATVEELTGAFDTMVVLYIVFEDDYGNKSIVGSKSFAEKLEGRYNALNINSLLNNADVYLVDMSGFNDFYDELQRMIHEVKAEAEENIFITGGISMLFDNVRDTYEHFRQSESALEQQAVKNMTGSYIEVYSNRRDRSRRIIDIAEQNNLLNYLRNRNIDGINEFFDVFSEKIQKISFANMRDTCIYLMKFLNIIISSGDESEEFYESTEMIIFENIYNVEAMVGFLRHKFLLVASEEFREKTEKIYLDIHEYIKKHYMESLSLDSIAEVFTITPGYLSTYFKKHSGRNISHYIMDVRMEKAAQLLRENTKMKISEIAESVGIPSNVTFNRAFKKYYNMQPREYRTANSLERLEEE